MNVTLYAIAKNEEKTLEKFIEISKKFSYTVVVDTGSTDKTVELLKEAGIEVYEHSQTKEEFDFSKARNQALSYIKTDWAFSLDFNEKIDDLYLDGFDILEDEFTEFKHLRFDDNGKDEPVQSNEVHIRFHRTKNYKWINAVHEMPVFVATEEFPQESTIETTIKITKTIHKSISKELFYFDICEREYKKDPTNWYYIWFIFNHYFNVGNYQKALEYGQEYLNVSKAYFDTFRVLAFIKCSICCIQLQDISKGANYAFHAVSEAMNIGEPYLSQAFIHLNEIAKGLNNPSITIFATAFNPETIKSIERLRAIDDLYLTNLEGIPSCWEGHRNFAEWLVRYKNPEVIVDLGTDWGYSAFSFAMPRIGHIYSVDNYIGDDFVGDQSMNAKYEFVTTKKKKLLLDDNITFIEGDFNEVAKTWNKKIDILHIDGSHHYQDIKRDFETWSQFLNEDSVILMHNTCVEQYGENPDYGVKKFFDEITLPKFTFTHCFGLGVVCKNESILTEIKNNFFVD